MVAAGNGAPGHENLKSSEPGQCAENLSATAFPAGGV